MKHLYVCALLSTIISCTPTAENPLQYEYANGLWVEVVDSTDYHTRNPYNEDNIIYTPGKEYIYEYQFFTKEGQECKFSREGYDIKPIDSLTTSTLTKLSITPLPNFSSLFDFSEYPETILRYKYYTIMDSLSWPLEHMGVIENQKNVWMHPWRRWRLFYMLQINPYPFIQAPFEIGHNWEWELTVGEEWGDEAWATWEGGMTFDHQYKIVTKEMLDTSFAGEVECYIVEGTGTSKLGQSKLTSYFNETYGFIRLDYLNIDSTQMIITLTDIKKTS